MSDNHDALRAAICDVDHHMCRTYKGISIYLAWQRVRAAAESTLLPKTKEIDVWHVEVTDDAGPMVIAFTERGEAEDYVRNRLPDWKCVRVTGPHKHEVPA